MQELTFRVLLRKPLMLFKIMRFTFFKNYKRLKSVGEGVFQDPKVAKMVPLWWSASALHTFQQALQL